MKLWVGITDSGWFRELAALAPDEVNFWQPSGSRAFNALKPGEIFLFKLHHPENFIVGGGIFVRHSPLPCSLAWEAFGNKNGVSSLSDLIARVRRYRPGINAVDPMIGCNVLAEPFFFRKEEWIPAPVTWAKNIVQGKTFDTASGEGRNLLSSVISRRKEWQSVQDVAVVDDSATATRYGQDYLTRGRLGQGAFRVLVTDAYQRRCAISGEKTLPVLEAAHIKPYASEGPRNVRNGLLLRSDIHKLFDLGYITVTLTLNVEVSPRLREEWTNGREYYAYHGSQLKCRPGAEADLPDKRFLMWHNENRFTT